jgi:FAD-dependent urate hydroxylase
MRIGQEMDTAPRSTSSARYDAVVVGAGPYGLSTAAHLLGRGLRVAAFGKTLEFWRAHMPKGMLLRSHWWATDLSDPDRQYTFGRFLERSADYEKGYPMPREAFLDYANWFQERAVPHVDETYVSSIERHNDHFVLTLEDGRSVHSATVVMAIGLQYYASRPAPFDRLPAGLVSHACAHHDLSRFSGQRVVVIGGGQSAVEYSALLHEAGAAVHLVPRRPIRWLPHDRINERSVIERILVPDASIAPGWSNWILDHAPYLLYHLPQHRKDRRNHICCTPSATEWLKDRVLGKVSLHEGQTVVATQAVNGHVQVAISDGEEVRADHVILATGYPVDIDKLPMVHPSLRAAIKTAMGAPVLSSWFESSVPGFYFVGLTSMRAFGPLYRFVAGCGAAARRVAHAVARQGAHGRLSGFRTRDHAHHDAVTQTSRGHGYASGADG